MMEGVMEIAFLVLWAVTCAALASAVKRAWDLTRELDEALEHLRQLGRVYDRLADDEVLLAGDPFGEAGG